MHNTRYCIVLFSSLVRAIVLLENNGKILANINIYIVYHAKRIKWQQKFYFKCCSVYVCLYLGIFSMPVGQIKYCCVSKW